MKFNFKEYQKQKIQNYFKNNSFILFAVNANQKSQNRVILEQTLYKLKINSYKIYNKTTKKVIKNSIHKNIVSIISTTFFFLKSKSYKSFIKTEILSLLNNVFFTILAIKLNKNIYSILQFKNILSLHYRKSVSILYQCFLTNLKSSLVITLKKNLNLT